MIWAEETLLCWLHIVAVHAYKNIVFIMCNFASIPQNNLISS